MPTCKQCQNSFEITDDDRAFYKKMDVLEPTLCPHCRMQRRFMFRNDRSLYKTQSSLSQKPMFSMYNPKKGYVVYDQKEWWKGDWDPLQYGQTFDFNKTFFEQFQELQKRVPRFNLFNLDTENCDYVNYAPHCKNCYLMFGTWFSEDCMYGQTVFESKNCLDCAFLVKSEYVYENIDCEHNYQTYFCQNCGNMHDSYFCYDCKNLENCIGCWNLQNKSYYIFNKEVTKEAFEEEKTKLASYSYLQEFKKRFKEKLIQNAIFSEYTGSNNENASGDFLFNCKNAKECYSVYRCENVAYCTRLEEQKDSYDVEGGGRGELTYESMSNDFAYNSIACTTSEHLSNSYYCDLCFNNDDIFGCIGLRKKKFCILNKQYTEEEYKALKEKIIAHMKKAGEWGQFFPASLSPFAYNETMAYEYFPLTKEEVEKAGFAWKEAEEKKIIPQTVEIPDNIHDVTDEICKAVLACETCKKNFKITQKEFDFYKKHSIPVPHVCPDCRHRQRMSMRTPRYMWTRNCAKCSKEIRTTYDPKRPEKVYCKGCYMKEVY